MVMPVFSQNSSISTQGLPPGSRVPQPHDILLVAMPFGDIAKQVMLQQSHMLTQPGFSKVERADHVFGRQVRGYGLVNPVGYQADTAA